MPKSNARKSRRAAAAKPKAPTYKLSAFNARIQIEPARMLFKLKGEPFEDVRLEYHGEEWQKLKGDRKRFPFGMLPVLEKEGKVLTQSRAIWRYLAREFDYYGNNNEEDSEIDVLCEAVGDVENGLRAAFEEQDEAKRKEYLVKSRDSNLKPFFDFFAEAIENSAGMYFVGDRITLADLAVFTSIDLFIQGNFAVEGYFESYPALLKFYEGIKSDSPLADYLEDRPITPY